MRALWIACLPLLLTVGCASGNAAPAPKASQDEAVAADRPSPTGTRKKGGDTDKKKDTNVYAAKVTDKDSAAKNEPFTLESAVLFVPEVSLFGGSSGKDQKVLELRRGKSTTIEIPFHRIERIEVGKQLEDRLELRIALRGTKPEDKWLKGTVKASLQFKGIFAGKDLTASVKLREVKTIELSVLKKG